MSQFEWQQSGNYCNRPRLAKVNTIDDECCMTLEILFENEDDIRMKLAE